MNNIIKFLKEYANGNITENDLRIQLNIQRKEFTKNFSIDKIENEIFIREILTDDSDDFYEVVKNAIENITKTTDVMHYVGIKLPYKFNEVLESVFQLVVKNRELKNSKLEQGNFSKEFYLCRETIFNSYNCLTTPKTIYDIIYNNIIVLAESMTDTGDFCMNSIYEQNDYWCMKKLEHLLEVYKGNEICLLGYTRVNNITSVSLVL